MLEVPALILLGIAITLGIVSDSGGGEIHRGREEVTIPIEVDSKNCRCPYEDI